MPADPQRIQSIFLAAIEAADPAARAALLARECGDDAELRQRIEVLLQAHDRSGSFLDQPAVQPVTIDDAAGQWIARDAPLPLTEQPGMRVGHYKLLQQIGEGGMGVVYMAEQQEPVRRMVALKIIKPGMDSDAVVARFEAERQALALMDHQNIARVFDGGTTESGRPFFVMELVKGIPITRFCDENRLTPRERLELFVSVCEAVQHAHQKGVIHRDLKPSNVLVTLYDGKPVSKVIDFGVAKALHQRLTERTMFTAFGAVVGTLEYMSPEQAEMNALDVDTRSDVYSLGVLLYELLTGTTPLERECLRKAAYTEMLRLIREEEPLRPSMRISGSGQALARISAQRKTEPAQLARLVRGELDWIVMKSLEKDRGRRYETATGLARDVERYLKDEPVEACPPTVAYQLGKLARKYKKALATTAAFVALLVAGVVVSASLAVWATSAEREANQLRIASDEAKDEALGAKAEADKQRDEARVTAYMAGINLAQRYWEENNVVRARELLEEIPKKAGGKDLRGFEWYYLSRLFHSELLTLPGDAGMLERVAFSPDGQRLATLGERTVIRESATGKELFSLTDNAVGVLSVAFSPDGQRLASGSRAGPVKIWDSTTGKELLSLEGHVLQVWSVAFSPDGQRLASGGIDGRVKIWDSVTGKELFTLEGHDSWVWSVAFGPDGQRLASGSKDKTARIWDSVTGKELFVLKGHAGEVNSVAFSPDGQRLASGSDDTTVKIWDSATGKELFALTGHFGNVNSVLFSPDGQRLVSGSEDMTVRIWDSVTGRELFALKGHAEEVRCVALSPDGQRLASASWDGTVKIWDSSTGKEYFALKGDNDGVRSVALSPDGKRLASAARDNTLRICDRATGKELFSLKGHAGEIVCVAFSPDGQHLASGSADATVRIWDSATGKELFSLKGHAKGIRSVAFSPDSQRLASGSEDRTVKIWESATGKELFSLRGHVGVVLSVVFSPDGQRLASGCDRTIIWDTGTGKELLSLKVRAHAPVGHRLAPVVSLVFSPNGQRLTSVNDDNSIHLWETSVPPEVQDRRAAHQLVADLFRQMGFRASVLERLQTLPGMNPTRRQEALTAAQTYPENPETLNNLAWQVVKLPGREMSGYRKALRYSEGASQLEPRNGRYLTTLGLAHYRLGNYEKALEMLQRANSINKPRVNDSISADLAFLAMTRQRLGHTKEAEADLQRLRQLMKEPGWRRLDTENQGFLREAEAVLANQKTPGGK